MNPSLVIWYVSDPAEARRFYRALLLVEPTLDAPGMTEFALPGGLQLGLMPEAGIRRLLPELAQCAPHSAGAARAELYLRVEDPQAWLERALAAGARLLDPVAARDWGERAGYVLDPWGHVLAFAC
jgi:catechol 2,3-dioxygenase-like lactoylglutathione lyase family enzyme